MGVYREMSVAVFLKEDIPSEIFAAFRYMVGGINGENDEGDSPPNPFPVDEFPSADNGGNLFRWFNSFEPSSEYAAKVYGLDVFDPEGYIYGGTGVDFPGEHGAVLRKVYRYNMGGLNGGRPVYTWMLSFRVVTKSGDGTVGYFEFADNLMRYSASEGFVGYYRADYEDTPTLLYCRDGKLYAYEVPWDPERLQSLWRT